LRPPATVPATVPSVTAFGARAADAARRLVGAPYQFGGQDPRGFDCSGLVWYVYRELGVTLPRRAIDQRAAVQSVPREALVPGDLVFFSSPQDHVGIYLGNGDFVHAPGVGKDVRVANLKSPYFELAYAGGGRVAAP
jgi:cell wall-associated NlpC family hydrolase